MLELMVLIPVEKGSIVGEFIICIESFGALCPVVFSIPIYLFCQTSCSLSKPGLGLGLDLGLQKGLGWGCPSLCNAYSANNTDTVCYYNQNGKDDNSYIPNSTISIGGEVVNMSTLKNCTQEICSGASKLHAGVVGVLLGSIALAFMS